MAILKGDWVIVEGEGVGQVTQTDFTPKWHLVDLIEKQYKKGFAVLRGEHSMTKIDPVFVKLLTDVYKESDDDKTNC